MSKRKEKPLKLLRFYIDSPKDRVYVIRHGTWWRVLRSEWRGGKLRYHIKSQDRKCRRVVPFAQAAEIVKPNPEWAERYNAGRPKPNVWPAPGEQQ